MANYLDVQHISNALHSYEAARSGFFTFVISDLDNIVKYTYDNSAGLSVDEIPQTEKYDRAQEYIMLNVVKVNVPQPTIEAETIRRGNEVIKFAKTVSFPEGSLVVGDYIGVDTKGILMSWLNLAYDMHTRKGGYMKDYKKTCYLIEYTQAHEQVRKWTLEGCWISKIDEGDFDVENDGKRQLTATIQFDRAVMDTDDGIAGQPLDGAANTFNSNFNM